MEFLASSWGKEFVAGGFGGIAGVISGYPLDSIRVRQQNSKSGSAFRVFRNVIATEGPLSLYRGMAAPLASVLFQNAMVFQIYATLSRAFDRDIPASNPPSYKGVALGGTVAGAIQSLIISPVELVKIQLQLQSKTNQYNNQAASLKGPIDVTRRIFRHEGWRGIYRGLTITVVRDAHSHGLYFWVYEYTKEQLHPGCRKNGQESFQTMLIAGGLAGAVSWISCYPLDVVKTRLQAQSHSKSAKYHGIVDCFRRSVRLEGHAVLWRGVGTTVGRAFLVNGAIFTVYETALRCLFNNNNNNHANV
ncbi:PREDICTED: mitochondrial arginine transporter BAC2-like [Nicotiana attenuata]|uniref:Mitochondrial arginine transporter bac2 n=1 Tax=Nicotiana attenuata TaxID=49451 RepID=A0A1J6K605_NICAT|nr:PREDICTED: mitochondrial arginine transporter BAC2-like [Nicotiana attenuata]OIT20472.1 mitochondrial arginine transporter bac2 [Nicotiana attenuata]